MSGIIGTFNIKESATALFYGLHALQHRGQEGAGIMVSNGTELSGMKNFGIAQKVFDEQALSTLSGIHGIGHVHYPTKERRIIQNIQPFLFKHSLYDFSVCHHGEIVNSNQLRLYLEESGTIFQSDSDSELFAHLVNHHRKDSVSDSIKEALNYVDGGFAFLYLTSDALYAIRDRHGLATLSLGKLDGGYVMASETCAIDILGGEVIRDIQPGEILKISHDGVISSHYAMDTEEKISAMEFIYYSRPDSDIAGINVHNARKKTGKTLARESHVEADIVVGIPDSSLSAAYGYAEETGVPFEMGLIKNRYVGRTFIMESQKLRDQGVMMKLSPIKAVIKDKRIILVDDSLVRGTTSKKIVAMMREAGAKEIHLRIACPEIIAPYFYGLDSYSADELISNRYNKEALCKHVGADTLEFLSIDGLDQSIEDVGLYLGCFNEDYPTHIYESEE